MISPISSVNASLITTLLVNHLDSKSVLIYSLLNKLWYLFDTIPPPNIEHVAMVRSRWHLHI